MTFTPRNWDINGWCVDCRPGPVAPVRRACPDPVCTFVGSGADDLAAALALFDHHMAVHLLERRRVDLHQSEADS